MYRCCSFLFLYDALYCYLFHLTNFTISYYRLEEAIIKVVYTSFFIQAVNIKGNIYICVYTNWNDSLRIRIVFRFLLVHKSGEDSTDKGYTDTILCNSYQVNLDLLRYKKTNKKLKCKVQFVLARTSIKLRLKSLIFCFTFVFVYCCAVDVNIKYFIVKYTNYNENE